MKCPGCSLAITEQTDVCPRCLIDLRKFKRAIGLPVTAANASYAEILAGMGIVLKEPEKKESKLKKVWAQIKTEKAAPIVTEVVEPKPLPVPQPTLEVKPKPVVKKKPAKAAVKPTPKQPEKLGQVKPKFLPKPDLAMSPVFAEAFASLPAKPLASEISTHAFVDSKSERGKELLLLFEFCMESLSDPDFYKRYLTTVPKKQIETIQSKKLEEQVAAAEAAVTAEELSLKKPKISVRQQFLLVDAKPYERFFSFLIDCLSTIVFLLILSVSWRSQYDASISLAILDFQPIDPSEVKIIFGFIMALFPFTLSLYFIFAHLLFKRTIGELITQTRVVTEAQKMPSFSHLLVRDGTVLLTILSGYLYPKFLRDTVSGLLSKTKVVRPVWE